MQKRSFYRTWTSDIPVTRSGCIRIRVTGVSVYGGEFGGDCTRKSDRSVIRSGCIRFHLDFKVQEKATRRSQDTDFACSCLSNLELLHTKKRHTCEKIWIRSNSKYFDFEMDPDRVIGVSLFCRDIRIVLHPKKRHAGHRIRMHSISLDFVLRPKKRHTCYKIQILLALNWRKG